MRRYPKSPTTLSILRRWQERNSAFRVITTMFASLISASSVGIGSDYDGVGPTLPVGLEDVSKYPALVSGMPCPLTPILTFRTSSLNSTSVDGTGTSLRTSRAPISCAYSQASSALQSGCVEWNP